MKLEHLKLIDTAYRKGRGKTRVVIKKYDSKLVLDALNEFKF